MSYTDGIGNLQQALSSVAPATTAPTQQISAAEREAQANATTTTAATQAADRADLSTTGGLISKAMEGSDVRTAKVEALQQAIASGSYNVSSSDVADKMIDSLLD
jgi:negative regulator of flagellin synthesis FlgM